MCSFRWAQNEAIAILLGPASQHATGLGQSGEEGGRGEKHTLWNCIGHPRDINTMNLFHSCDCDQLVGSRGAHSKLKRSDNIQGRKKCVQPEIEGLVLVIESIDRPPVVLAAVGSE